MLVSHMRGLLFAKICKHLFLREETHEAHPSIYSIFLTHTCVSPKQGIYPHLCTSIVNVAICTSIVIYKSWRHFHRAICTSIDVLEPYPNAYAGLKKSKCVCKDSSRLSRCTSRKLYWGYRNRLLPKEGISRLWYSVYRGKENPRFSDHFHFSFLCKTKSS